MTAREPAAQTISNRALFAPVGMAVIWGQWVAAGFLVRQLVSALGGEWAVSGWQILRAAAIITLLLAVTGLFRIVRWILTGQTRRENS